MTLLKVINIEKRYHSDKGEVEAIKNISFTVDSGEYISILGPSGCGKSTLLNIMSGLISQSSGEIYLNNFPLKDNLDSIGYMFQKDHLFPWTSIYNNIILGLKIRRLLFKDNLKYVDSLMKKYDLDQFKNHKPNEISGGMRQRVSLIRTLSLNPEILFLDEPFSALDYQTRLNVANDIHQIIKSEKKTAIMVTHDISEAISVSDRIILLSKRPSIIKKIIPITFENATTPFSRRNSNEFKNYFNYIWNEMEE
ncbi:MAG: ABC transporter ATP-binding protein [Clostridium sp.]|uniref:ABC transporter ATP-binding protein n=1 Tax=Clostridium sp. TaxID=1506 RepID=UPI003EE6A689